MVSEPVILAVDDERAILQLINTELREQGFRVLTAENGDEALKAAEEYRPDLTLLDVMMPGSNGLEVMRKLREIKHMPIILLTAMGSSNDKVRGLELGADDYVAKPFDPAELGARVRAVLRRASTKPEGQTNVSLDNGRIDIDLEGRLVRKNGELVNLSRTEWLLLHYLASNPGKALLNNQILSSVWGPEYLDEFQYLRVWVHRLRQKLEENPSEPRIIKTLPGIGLILVADEPASILSQA
jgi:two-component system KDP operon response regulator KdpE